MEEKQQPVRKCYSLPIGPQHPMYVEAENLAVTVDGETITKVDVNIGYMHRGIEELMQRRNYIQGIYLSERICGICMPGEQEVILGDGSIVPIKDIVDKTIPGKTDYIEVSPIAGHNTIAWNDGHCKVKNITAVQKVKSPKRLYKFRTKSGSELVFTGDHPIMIDSIKGPVMIKSKDVNIGDWAYSPRKIDIEPCSRNIFNFIPHDFKIILDRKYFLWLKKFLINKHGSLKNLSEKTGISLWRLWRLEKKFRLFELKRLVEYAGLEWDEVTRNIVFISKMGVSIRIKQYEIDEEMMYVLGLIASDGYFGNYRPRGKYFDHRITFVNKQEVLIEKVERFHNKWFPERSLDRLIMMSDTPALRISNPVLTYVAQSLGLNALSNKKTDLSPIFKLPEREIAAFIRGYFDGDGTARKTGQVILYTNKKEMANRLCLLLKRVGIASSVSGSASRGFKPGMRYSVSITNMRDIQRFQKIIGSGHPNKRKAISEMFKSRRKDTFKSFFQYSPRRAGPLIKRIRERHNIKQKEICKISDYSSIESGNKNAMKWRLSKYASKLKSLVPEDDKEILELENMLSDKFFMDPIIDKQEIECKNTHVYDMTVDGVHNFIPGGAFVVSNCSGVHSMTYSQVVENLLNLDIPERAKLIRMVILELERLHSHLLFLGVMGYQMGLDTVFMYAWRDREHVQDMLELVSGNRVNYAMFTIGGVRRPLPGSKSGEILKRLKLIEKGAAYYEGLFKRDISIRSRTIDIGILPRGYVLDYSIIGPVARGSGVRTDVRADVPYLLYDDVEWKVVVRNGCDVHARIMVKVLEMYQSIRIIRACISRLARLSDTDLVNKAHLFIPPTEAIAVSEAPRGELIYYARSNGTDMPERMRIRTPTFMNLLYCLPPMLEGQQLADLPVIVASADPCFSCCDRVTLVDEKTGSVKMVDEAWLKRLEKGRSRE